MKNGELEELQIVFADLQLEFRCYPDATNNWLRYQAGRMTLTEIELSDGSGRLVEVFELICFSSSANGLSDKLAALPLPSV